MQTKNFLYKIILVILYCITCFNIYKDFKTDNINKVSYNTKIKEFNPKLKEISIEKPKYYIKIKSLNIQKPIYNIESDKNNVEENVTLLQETNTPEKENSHIFIAAHSGTGDIAYFNDIDKLKKDNEIIITYNNKEYIYKVYNIKLEHKNGYIHINKYIKNTVTLTTCSKIKDKQLIITAIKKD